MQGRMNSVSFLWNIFSQGGKNGRILTGLGYYVSTCYVLAHALPFINQTYNMKQLITYLTCLFFSVAVRAAGDGPTPVPAASNSVKATKMVNAGAVRFEFNNNISAQDHKDSVLIIFDRFDHTGAGVIYQVYAASNDNSITIPEIPAGKYYVTIQCLGLHHDRLEKTISIKKQKNEKVKIELEASEVFSKDNVKIPAYRPNFSDLSILKSK